ncbi:MAG: caspase family protein [Candidatus Thorarchaeota archaeon]
MNKKMTFGIGIISLFVIFTIIPFAVSNATNSRAITTDAQGGDVVLATEAVTATGDGIVNKYAVIVGISDYKAINDLTLADEDAVDWFNQLDPLGYECKVFGDGTNYYPQFDGLATEYAVKQAITYYLSIADGDDIFVFATSGHGGATKGKTRNSFLCMWDCSSGELGENGYIYDYEMQPLFAPAVCKWFIFLDHCNSGGMDEVMTNANSANGYMATTCTAKGYGYDYPPGNNGAWTYFFLEVAWQQHFGGGLEIPMETIFDYAVSIYPYDGYDLPQEFDGNTGALFYL